MVVGDVLENVVGELVVAGVVGVVGVEAVGDVGEAAVVEGDSLAEIGAGLRKKLDLFGVAPFLFVGFEVMKEVEVDLTKLLVGVAVAAGVVEVAGETEDVVLAEVEVEALENAETRERNFMVGSGLAGREG